MGVDTKRGKDLEAAREALASWRRTHGGRGRPIPPVLWSKAADVARGLGVPEVARARRKARLESTPRLEPCQPADLAPEALQKEEDAQFEAATVTASTAPQDDELRLLA